MAIQSSGDCKNLSGVVKKLGVAVKESKENLRSRYRDNMPIIPTPLNVRGTTKRPDFTITTTMRFNRKALSYLLSQKDNISASQLSFLQSINLKKSRKSLEGQFESKYNLSRSKAGQLGYGRVYGTKGSFEQLERAVRGTMCREYYHDIDIVNCHPVMLSQFAKEKYGKDLPELDYYIANRDKVLAMLSDDRDEAKEMFIKVFYGGKPTVSVLEKLHEEMRSFTRFLLQQTEFADLKKAVENADNVYGSFLAQILQSEEREVMIIMMNTIQELGYKVEVLAYDGVMVSKDAALNIKEMLEAIECRIEQQIGYKLKVVEKPFDAYFELPAEKEEIVEGVTKDAYLTMKADFETSHFYFAPTNQYGEVDGGIVKLYDLAHATEMFQTKWRFVTGSKFTDYIEFFKLWRVDPSRRQVKSIDFKPTDDPNVFVCPLEFAYMKHEETESAEALEMFKKLLSLSTSGDAVLMDYVTKFFAHMLQNPFDVPKVALVFTGIKGCGKDTLVDFLIEWVMGQTYGVNYQSNKQFFDPYDCGRANKFLVKLEEADRKACLVDNPSHLKSLITANISTFNPKGKSAYQLPNYNRFVFTTNNQNPMDMSDGERRFVISPCSKEQKGKLPFWNNVRKVLFNAAGGYTVAKYLLSVDLSEFDVRVLPENNYQQQVIDAEKSSEERFVEEWDGERVTSAELFVKYRSFCLEHDLPACKDAGVLGKLFLKFVRDGTVQSERGAGNKNFYWK